jgi:predicted MPP superfamily phosphohydrolase
MPNGPEPQSPASRIVTFLHLSDLHVGISQDRWLWPTVKSAFYADLRRLLPTSGLPDVVVFSGDLVQQASVTEYVRLTEILHELWGVFRELGCNPILVPVPGNHDLTRRPEDDLAANALRDWWTVPRVRKAFWAKAKGYPEFLHDSFAHYQQFVASLHQASIPMPQVVTHGLIPGDLAAQITVGDHTIGVVGLNSAWLQVGEGQFKGRLDVDPRQLMAVVDSDPDAWCGQNAANLLVTHHPESWLHLESQSVWKAEINCGTRFDCHLYGHMHEQQSSVVALGGYEGRRLLQGASLFGLEQVSNQKIERIHGYSVNQISRQGHGKGLRQWPRKATVGADGARKLIPNHDFNLTEGNCFDIEYNADVPLPTPPAPGANLTMGSSGNALAALRRVLPMSEPARHVRTIEQQACLDLLLKHRMAWVVADWGLGADEFLEAMIGRLSPSKQLVFQIDVGGYHGRDEMLDGIHRDFGEGFHQICESLSRQPGCVLIFDDVEVTRGTGEPNVEFLDALEDIGNAVLQYCPDARLIFRSRRRPLQTNICVVELTALNDLDAMLYIQNHPAGSAGIATESFVRKVMGHTDGLPSRIDEALRDIALLGVDGLHLVNPDVAGKAGHLQAPPPGLAEAIAQLETEDPASRRAARLLSVLSLFPRGEYLDSIRRFDHNRPFYAQDAHRLIELGLIDTTEVPNIGSVAARTNAKSLVAKRPVREYLTGHLPSEDIEKLNRQALVLYFGEQWTSGAIKPPKGTRFDERTCESWKIDNATLLIMREAKDAIEAGIELRIANAATLADSYCTALHNGAHYESLVRAANDFLAIYRDVEGHEHRRTNIESLLGRALRMCGDHEQSIAVLTKIVDVKLSNSAKSSILISLVLATEALGLDVETLRYALQCIEIDGSSRNAMQARSVVTSIQSKDHPKRKEKLLRLAREADKSGAATVASNLRLQCMQEEDDEQEKLKLARHVLEDARTNGNDEYNAMRAMLHVCQMSVSNRTPLSDLDLAKVIDAYHYLVNETMDGLFGLAHRVLWRHFALTGDVTNLLSLFRHSSFKWQLRGKGTQDLKYATEVSNLLAKKLHGGAVHPSREIAYLFWRSGQSLRLLD